MNTILNDYNKRARPVQKETDVVNILLDIALPQVMKVVSAYKVLQLYNNPSYSRILIGSCL